MRSIASLLRDLENPNLSSNERAVMRCQVALELKEKGDYEEARQAMGNLWRRVGEHPKIKGLYPDVAAEVLLCVGILTGWIGGKNNVAGAQETAKNLISESISIYESLGDLKKVAEARSELAYCYWREGAIDEARIMLNEALKRLTTQGNTRAKAILRLAIVEWSALRYSDALRILIDNAVLFEKIPNHAIRGAYHNQLAMVYNCLAISEQREDYIQQAIREYELADHHLKIVRNLSFRVDVLDNLGFLYYKISHFDKAHEYLNQAHRLASSIKDRRRIAIVEETQARTLIAEGKFTEADKTIRSAISILERSGQQYLLAEALTTRGVILARLGSYEQAQFTLERAIEIAHQAGALDKAGLAALTLIEELADYLAPDILRIAYERADQWLSKSQDLETIRRLSNAAKRLLRMDKTQTKPERTLEPSQLSKQTPYRLHDKIHAYERTMIRQALTQVGGSLTKAAELLGLTHQGLAYIIETRHPDLLKERSPIHRRSRKEEKGER
jgi:tetratricopeptide (TPR) repeat protein